MEWKVCIISYNVAMKKSCEEAIEGLFSTIEDTKPHIVAVGLQEVAHAETLGGSWLTWQRLMTDWMSVRGEMVLLAKNYQATNQLTVYVRKSLLVSIRNLEFRYSRNTLGGLTGHKGSIGLKIALKNNTSIVLVDSHFVHDVRGYERRITQCTSNAFCMFPEDTTVKSTFWFGDLNFRVELEPEEAMELLEKDLDILKSKDQLHRAMRERRILLGFHEQNIAFKPSYRLLMGTTEYDLKRTPSWCDRILYKGSQISPVSYGLIDNVLVSDHLPVRAVFDVKIDSLSLHLYDWECVFEHLPPWYSTVPLIGRFQLRNNYWKKKGSYMDWVGVFPSSILDCTTAIRWLWVVTCCEQVVADQVYIVCEFPCLFAGSYRLGYFSNYNNCLVGLSKTFVVTDPLLENSVN